MGLLKSKALVLLPDPCVNCKIYSPDKSWLTSHLFRMLLLVLVYSITLTEIHSEVFDGVHPSFLTLKEKGSSLLNLFCVLKEYFLQRMGSQNWVGA